MSLQVQLLFSFPQGRVSVVSGLLLLFGCCSIGVSVLGFIYNIWGYYVAAGAWGGGVATFTGFCGIIAAYKRGVCNVVSFMIVAYFSCISSIGQMILSIGGLEYKSNFYLNAADYESKNQGTTKLLHGLLVGFALFQVVLCAVSAGICTKEICLGRQKVSKARNTSNYFQRGTVRDSASSQAPLVSSSSRGRKHKKRKSKNKHSSNRANDNITNADLSNRYNSDQGSRIRGRRFGNMPTVGSNVVEYTNSLERNRHRNVVTSAEMADRGRGSDRRGGPSNRRRGSTGNYSRRPNLSLEYPRRQSRSQERETRLVDMSDHQDTSDLQNQTNRKLALEQGEPYIDIAGPENNHAMRSHPDRPVLTNRGLNFERSDVGRTSYFIPIERSFEAPLSIDDDEELPPYQEVVPKAEAEDESLIPVSQVGTSLHSDDFSLSSLVSEQSNERLDFPNQSKSRQNAFAHENGPGNSHGNATENIPMVQMKTNRSRPVSYHSEMESNMVRERSKTIGNVSHNGFSQVLPSSERERFVHNYFFTDQDPQGVSYYGIMRDGDQIFDREKPKRSRSMQYCRERELAKGGVGKLQNQEDRENVADQLAKEAGEDRMSCYSQPNVQSEYDGKQFVRRLSKASTISLPASMAPPKPPRIFNIQIMDNTKKPQLDSKALSPILSPTGKEGKKSVDEGQAIESKTKSDKRITLPRTSNTSHEKYMGKPSFYLKEPIDSQRQHEHGKKNMDQSNAQKMWEPLSIETNTTQPLLVHTNDLSNIANTPFAHSSPKMTNVSELSVHQESPSLSPIIADYAQKRKYDKLAIEGPTFCPDSVKMDQSKIRPPGPLEKVIPENVRSQSAEREKKNYHPLSLQPYLQTPDKRTGTEENKISATDVPEDEGDIFKDSRVRTESITPVDRNLQLSSDIVDRRNKNSNTNRTKKESSQNTGRVQPLQTQSDMAPPPIPTRRTKLPSAFDPVGKNLSLSVFSDQIDNVSIEDSRNSEVQNHLTQNVNSTDSSAPTSSPSSHNINISKDQGYHSNAFSSVSISDGYKQNAADTGDTEPVPRQNQQQPTEPSEQQATEQPQHRAQPTQSRKPIYSVLL